MRVIRILQLQYLQWQTSATQKQAWLTHTVKNQSFLVWCFSQQHPEAEVCQSIGTGIVLQAPRWSGASATFLTSGKLAASSTEDHIQVS